jgi:flagellar motor protein MotB
MINTPYLEGCPFLASDGVTLYFSSTKPGGLGDADIYRTRRLDESWTKWSMPENLGPAINSSNRETYYSLSASGDYAFMVTNPGEHGKSDIVKVRIEEKERPDPVVLVSGRVLNAITREPLEAAIEYEILAEGKKLGVAESDPETGEYKMVLPKGKQYGFSAEAGGFLSVSENLDLSNLSSYKEIEKDLLLVPIQKGQTVRLNNIFFESGSAVLKPESFPELDRLAVILNIRKSMEIEIVGHTDFTGEETLNQELS